MTHTEAKQIAKERFGSLASVYKRNGVCIVMRHYYVGNHRGSEHMGRGATYAEALRRATEREQQF